MATDKLFTVAGTSKHPTLGHKVRFANDVLRVKNLAKSNHTDILLVELPNEMSKREAVLFIKGLDEFSGVAEQAAIADYLETNADPATKAPKTTKTKAPPTTDSIKAKVKAKVTPQVPALSGMTPMGFKELEQAVGLAPDLEDKPFGSIQSA